MRDIKDVLISEASMRTYEIKNYVKSCMTNSVKYSEYAGYIAAIADGIKEGLAENAKYYTGKRAEDIERVNIELKDVLDKLYI